MPSQFPLYKWISVFLILLLSLKISGQTPSETVITIELENKTLLEAISILEEEHGLNFSYDHTIIPKSKIVYTKVENASLDRFLKALLNGMDLDYKVINDHIVLYYSPKPKEEKLEDQFPGKVIKIIPHTPAAKDNIPNQNQEVREKLITIYDTVYNTINDTVFEIVYDTFQISIIDTIIVYDTLQVFPGYDDQPKPSSILCFQFGGLFPISYPEDFTFQIQDTELSQNESKYIHKPSWEVGINYKSNFSKILFQSSLLLSQYRREINLSYIGRTKYFQEFINDRYYEIAADTLWVDVRDSAQLERFDTINLTNLTSSHYYLSIPFELGYEIPVSTNLSLSVMGGIKSSFLLWEKAELDRFIYPNDKAISKKFLLSILVGAELNYQITKYLNLHASIKYLSGINSQMNQVNFNLGVSKSFY